MIWKDVRGRFSDRVTEFTSTSQVIVISSLFFIDLKFHYWNTVISNDHWKDVRGGFSDRVTESTTNSDFVNIFHWFYFPQW